MADQGACRVADMTQFFTYKHPEQYHPDWKGYYADALRRREAVLASTHHHLDVKYGAHPYQLMDIFAPKSESVQGAPVILYFHGGRWREGHPAFYDHMAAPWVAQGAIFVSCGYRLEPEATIADSMEDALAVVNWWGVHAAEYGGDPRRLVVSGHSAGGQLTAMVALTPLADRIVAGAEVSAAIVMSGVADLSAMQEPDADAISPVRHITRGPKHVIVSFGSPEPNKKDADDRFLTEQGELISRALTQAEVAHQTIVLGRMDHVATAAAFVDPASPLYRASQYAIFDR